MSSLQDLLWPCQPVEEGLASLIWQWKGHYRDCSVGKREEHGMLLHLLQICCTVSWELPALKRWERLYSCGLFIEGIGAYWTLESLALFTELLLRAGLQQNMANWLIQLLFIRIRNKDKTIQIHDTLYNFIKTTLYTTCSQLQLNNPPLSLCWL